MVELLFITCMAAAPEECSERRLILGDVTPAMCQRLAQPEQARQKAVKAVQDKPEGVSRHMS